MSDSFTTRFPRQSRRGVLLGFSKARLITGMFAATFLAIGFSLGGTGTVLGVMVALILIAGAAIRVQGRYLVEWMPVALHFGFRKTESQTRFRAQITSPRPAGTMALPGNAANLRFVDDAGVAYVHDPRANTLTAALRLEHSAMVLLDENTQIERVTGWSRALSSLAGSTSVDHVAVLEETILDAGDGPREWFLSHWSGQDDWASREYYALLDATSPQHLGGVASTHRTTFTVTVKVGRKGLSDAANNLRGQRANIEQLLRAAGLRVLNWLSTAELAQQIRGAFAPFSPTTSTNLAVAGPIAIDEDWKFIRHDDAYSTILTLAEFPATPVGPQFLHPLIFSGAGRHTFTLIAEVETIDSGLRQTRREKIASSSDRRQKAKLGQIEELSDQTEYAAIEQRELALLQGHAPVRLTGFITVTAPTREALDDAVTQAKRDAGQCACEARVLFGMQAAAFPAAALPIGRKTK